MAEGDKSEESLPEGNLVESAPKDDASLEDKKQEPTEIKGPETHSTPPTPSPSPRSQSPQAAPPEPAAPEKKIPWKSLGMLVVLGLGAKVALVLAVVAYMAGQHALGIFVGVAATCVAIAVGKKHILPAQQVAGR